MPDMSVANETLTLKTVAAEARRPEPAPAPTPAAAPASSASVTQLPPRPSRHAVSDEQLDALKSHRAGIEQPLLWVTIGICIGSATGSIAALDTFLKTGALSVEGFVQNMFFFSSLLAAIILLVVHTPRRKDFHRLVEGLRSRD